MSSSKTVGVKNFIMWNFNLRASAMRLSHQNLSSTKEKKIINIVVYFDKKTLKITNFCYYTIYLQKIQDHIAHYFWFYRTTFYFNLEIKDKIVKISDFRIIFFSINLLFIRVSQNFEKVSRSLLSLSQLFQIFS